MSGGVSEAPGTLVAPLDEHGDAAAALGFAATERGSRISLRRDQIFRRSLLVADLTAFVLAMAVVSETSGRELRITWLGLVGVIALFVGAKVYGLYDRDPALVHKTTLDEAPKLFQVATLGALCAWLAGGFVLSGGTLPRGEALLLWTLLMIFLVLTRASARTFALGVAPTERCLFIGDAAAAATVRGRFADNHGMKAEVVSSIDPADSAAWSADGVSAIRLREIRSLATSLDVQRAVVSADSFTPERMLDLICTMEAVGVKVSVLPRMLEVVGSSVEFDDLDGVTMMGVKRADLTRSSTFVKRAFDLVGAVIGLIAVAPLMAAIATRDPTRRQGPIFFKQRRVGQSRTPLRGLQVPHDGP